MDLSSRADEIRSILRSEVHPLLARHGGGVSLSGVKGQIVCVRISGSCRACPSLHDTLQEAVQDTLRRALNAPELTVIAEDGVSPDLIREALSIIRRPHS